MNITIVRELAIPSRAKSLTLLMMFTTLFYQAWQMSAIENRNDSGLSKFYTKIYGAYSSLLMIAAAGIIMLEH